MAARVRTVKVELRGVRKSFSHDGSDLDVLAGIDLAVDQGELACVIGPSGCGKSTLLKIVAGLELPTAGEVLVDDIPATGETGRFAYMPQSDMLMPWRRVIDNTTLGLEISGMSRRDARERVRPFVEAFGLSGFESSYPFQLSGGMRQRAALLRTVVQERSALLLDEPLGALDSLTRTDMQVWLESVWERYRWSMILVTHDVHEAVYLSDTVYVLSARPATVRARVAIDLPKPRSMEMMASPRATELHMQLLACLHGQAPGSLIQDLQ